MAALKAKFDEQRKTFSIEMAKNQSIEIESSGMFDTERELMAWAEKKGGKVLGYLDGSEKHQYLLVYGRDLYDVEVEGM